MKTAVVTGSSYGLGNSISGMLLSNDFKVYGVSRSDPEIVNPNFVWLNADLSEDDLFSSINSLILEDKIDLLVNNAGVAFLNPGLKFTNVNFNKIFSVNFTAPIKLTSELLPKLVGGIVINISSNSDRFAEPGYALYSASKAALNIYFDTVALENKNIKFFNLLPSYIETPMAHYLMDDGHNKDFTWDINMQPEQVAVCVKQLIFKNDEFKSGTHIIIVNDKLLDDTVDPEELYYYNVDTQRFKKLK